MNKNPGTYDKTTRIRRIVVLYSIIAAIIIAIGTVFLWWSANHKTIELEPTAGSEITFGIPTKNDKDFDEIIIKTDRNSKVTVPPGRYMVRFASEGFETKTIVREIRDDTKFTTPPLPFVKSKLEQRLDAEREALHSALSAQSQLPKGFQIVYENIYEQGNWYGAVLTPPTGMGVDNQRIIMHLEDSEWKIIAMEIAFTSRDYPGIPDSVRNDINNH